MEVYFASQKLANLLQDQRECKREFGAENARLIERRLQYLEYARDLADFASVVNTLHELKAERTGQLAFRLRGGLRMILSPLEDPPPIKPDGGLDWTKVKAVVVLSVEDYHA